MKLFTAALPREKLNQYGFLHMHPVLRLIKYNRMRTIYNFIRDLFPAVRRQAMHNENFAISRP